MTTLPLAALRESLRERERVLREELGRARDALLRRTGRVDDELRDRKDLAARRVDDVLADAEGQRDLDELHAVGAALQRLAEGRYGCCEDCGAPIGIARLVAQPAASRCLECQDAHERRDRAAAG